MKNKIPNDYIAIVELSEKDRKKIEELLLEWTTKFNLKGIAIDLLNNEICKDDNYDANTIRMLIREATNEKNSTSLKNIFMCIAKGLYWCTEKELRAANIRM